MKEVRRGAPGTGAHAIGGDSADDSATTVENHDPIKALIARIRAAAERGEPLAAGAKVRVKRIGGDLFRVDRT